MNIKIIARSLIAVVVFATLFVFVDPKHAEHPRFIVFILIIFSVLCGIFIGPSKKE